MKRVVLAFALAVMVMVSGCMRMAPLVNVTDSAVTTGSEKSASLKELGEAVIRAGGALGWRMQRVKPGHIVGTLFLRSHMAAVDITFNEDIYSIIYKNSSNLKYDGAEIHRDYNSWVKKLDDSINSQFSML